MPNGISFVLIAVVLLALTFDFINGFHDTANAIATTISTRALTPRVAIILSALFNFIGAFANQKVAGTIADKLVDNKLITISVLVAALISAIAWNLITWYIGIPSSSSHALFGSIIGASIAYTAGFNVIKWSGVFKNVIFPLLTSPIIGFFLGFLIMKLLYALLKPLSQRTVNKWFSKLQIISALLMSYAHGSNDAQKSMGIITLALIILKVLPAGSGVPLWVIIACAMAMAVGTSVGGWRIIKTVGMNMIKLQPIQGFAAQTGATAVILASTHFSAPVSTTHIITTAVMGVGASKRMSAVRWGLAKNIAWAWLLTIPTTVILGAIVVSIFKLFI